MHINDRYLETFPVNLNLRGVPQNLGDDLVDVGSHGGLVLWTNVDQALWRHMASLGTVS